MGIMILLTRSTLRTNEQHQVKNDEENEYCKGNSSNNKKK